MNPIPKAGDDVYAVVIPAYNERATVRGVAARTLAHIDAVIVVDDGSTDGTAESLDGLPVVVLRHDSNRGKGYSLWRGIQHARSLGATVVITLDADGQHSPEDIPRLIAEARSHPAAIVIGARVLSRGRAPRSRRWANRTADFWIGVAAGQAMADSQSGFRLYPARLFDALQIGDDSLHGFVFESELLITAARKGAAIRNVPIEATPPHGARRSHFGRCATSPA